MVLMVQSAVPGNEALEGKNVTANAAPSDGGASIASRSGSGVSISASSSTPSSSPPPPMHTPFMHVVPDGHSPLGPHVGLLKVGLKHAARNRQSTAAKRTM